MKLAKLLAGVALGVLCCPALAYNVFPYGTNQALKWGNNTIGTSGGVVTWSLMPDNNGLDASSPTGISGTSQMGSLMNMLDSAYGAGKAMGALQNAFGYWSSVANISFVQVTETGSVPFAASYASVGTNVIGDIRIGAYNINGFSGAVGYAPKPNGGTTLEGDIIFNRDVAYQMAAGREGNNYYLYPNPSPTDPAKNGWYHNDFEGLFAHELGHALGLAHTNVTSALMCGYISTSFNGSTCAYFDQSPPIGLVPINRIPDADDIAGIQYLYSAPVPEPETWAMLLAGLGLVGFTARRRRLNHASSLPS